MINKEFLKTAYLASFFLCIISILSCKNTKKEESEDKLKPHISESATDSLNNNKYQEVTINNTESRRLKSQLTKETYEIDVFIPPEYNHDTIHYPIVFVLDAEYNFGSLTM